jgi:hypothetical protein
MSRNSKAMLALVGLLATGALLLYAAIHDGGELAAGKRVTEAELRRSLAASGLTIEWREARGGDGAEAVLAGVASDRGRNAVGFEFVLSSDEHADVDQLGRVEFRNASEREVRGILSNVAYANYPLLDRRGETVEAARTIYRLDDALFRVFPPDDAVAYPVRSSP